MQMIDVESSNVAQIGYDAVSRKLAVKFKGGETIYTHDDVPPEKHAALMASESKGCFYSANIKGQHTFTKG